jgi:hypothetical protein
MILQRAGNIEFRTVRGILAEATQEGFSHKIVDDENHHCYLIEDNRKSESIDHLVGLPIEVKGLIETDLSPEPKLHLIYCKAIEGYGRVI